MRINKIRTKLTAEEGNCGSTNTVNYCNIIMCVILYNIRVELQNKQGFYFPCTKSISIYEAQSLSNTHVLYIRLRRLYAFVAF